MEYHKSSKGVFIFIQSGDLVFERNYLHHKLYLKEHSNRFKYLYHQKIDKQNNSKYIIGLYYNLIFVNLRSNMCMIDCSLS